MVARPAEATKASSFAVLARRNNQNRMAIGVGMVSHALRAGLTILRSADGTQVAALGNQGHRRQSRHIYGATLTRSSTRRRCWLRAMPTGFRRPRVFAQGAARESHPREAERLKPTSECRCAAERNPNFGKRREAKMTTKQTADTG